MRNYKNIILIIVLLLVPQFTVAATWKVDPVHTAVEFKIRHLMISWVKGVFTDVEGTVEIDDSNLSNSSTMIKVAVASIDTNNQKRDDHLRSPDFFDATKFPTMTFVAKKVVVADGKPVNIIGALTIRDVTKDVVLEVEDFSQVVTDPWGNIKRGVSASTKINRKDFGLTWNKALETGGVVVGDEVHINLEVELVKG